MQSAECLSDERITELVEGRLTGAALAAAERHLAGCSDCRRLVSLMAGADESARRSGQVSETVVAPGVPGAEGAPVLQKNDRVGRYVIQQLLGAGGMGRVYAAHDPSLDRRVALKLLRAEAAAPDLESRLLREAKAMARITHPHVIVVHDTGRHGDQVYIAMELVQGGTLRDWLSRAPRTWREIVEMYARAGEGLAEAHAAGIVHRDFKPDNVLVGDDGKTVRVTDFGLARAVASDEPVPLGDADTQLASQESSPIHAPLTRTGALVGTPAYMAPEQHAARGADARSDLYSFSVALYEALYGERPFSGTTLAALHAAKRANEVRPPPKGTTVPPRVRRVVLAGLRADPEQRPPSMAALLAALRRAARGPTRSWAVAGGIAAALVTAIVAGVGRERPHGGGTTAASGVPGALAAAVPGCSNALCAREHGGQPWVCGRTSGRCVAIDDERCKAHYEPGDLEAEDTVWLGALLPTTGPIAALTDFGKQSVEAVELGRREFAQATRALTGPNASLRVRRVAVAVCDDGPAEGAMAAAEHLVDDVGVPAILGFRSGQELVDLAGGLLVQRKVVSVASLSSNPLITRVPQPADLPRMVWRTTFGMDDVATATAAFVRDYFEPRRSRDAGKVRVTLVRGASPLMVPFGQALLGALTFNGKSAVENGDSYQEIAVDDDARIEDLARQIARQAPTFIVVYLRSVPLATAIEAQWPRGVPRPTYLLASDPPESLDEFIGTSADRRRRVLGVLSTSDSAANAHFVIRFNEANADHVTRTKNPGASYDAFYMLAFAANAAGPGPVDGARIARAFERLRAPGRPIVVGPTDAFDALSELSQGRAIDLEGASSSLDFDVRTGEIGFDYALTCATADASGKPTGESVETGVTYRAASRRVTGSLSCP